jgi:hypothetical protein
MKLCSENLSAFETLGMGNPKAAFNENHFSKALRLIQLKNGEPHFYQGTDPEVTGM